MGFEDNPRDEVESYPCYCREGRIEKHEIGVCVSCGNEDIEKHCNNCDVEMKFWRCDTCDFPECNF